MSRFETLTAREMQCISGLAHGDTFKSVARNLGIALSTVANTVGRTYKKLGVCRREQAVKLFLAEVGLTSATFKRGDEFIIPTVTLRRWEEWAAMFPSAQGRDLRGEIHNVLAGAPA